MYKSSNNKQVTLDNVELKEEIKNMKGIAIMLEQDDGTYKESSTNTFPTDMKFNSELSGCIDNLGNRIEDSLTYENGIANVETSNTSYCYLYFDNVIYATNYLIENVSGDVLWESTLEDDGYRFIGTDPANYVCFGYSDVDTDCVFTSEPELSDYSKLTNDYLYAYRIIGIFEDSEGKQHLKLIKRDFLIMEDSTISAAWNSSNTVVDWEESDLYNGINGDYFLTNTTYSYMQDTNWINKIATWDYTAANTLTKQSSGPNYCSETAQNVYLHEMNRSTKSSTVGEWKIISAKIGLIYASDYLLSLGSEALNYTSESYSYQDKDGWMSFKNANVNSNVNYWTMSTYGSFQGFNAWQISSNTGVDFEPIINSCYVYPVFYLTSDVKISGEGTIENPYIIEN